MDQLKIAIFGSSGAIGSALCKKYIQQENVEKVYCFSRKKTDINHEKAQCFILDYLDEKNLSAVSSEINFSFDIILISIGALLNPEKSIKDLNIEKFNDMISANTLPTLLIGKYFLPIFIEKGLYTIPEFIEKRFSSNLKTILAVFWIALFVFVNLTTVLFLGGKALDTIVGSGDGTILINSIIGLALFAAAYSLWGGLAAVAWTDVVQVILLIIGVLMMTYFSLSNVTESGSFIDGIVHVYNTAP